VSSIVLKIPYESTAFHDALEVLRKPFPAATHHERQEILARVAGWTGITVAAEDAAYIPLQTDWMPNGNRRTRDGVEVLLGGRWPAEVQAALDAGKAAWIAGALIGRFWEMICDANWEKSSEGDRSEASDCPAAATVAGAPEPVALRDVGCTVDCSGARAPDGSPDGGGTEPANDLGPQSGTETRVSTPTMDPAIPEAAIPLHLIDGWTGGRVVTAIREWAKIYPDPVPDPNDLSEAEARSLLRTMLLHPDMIAEVRRRSAAAIVREGGYRDARTIQYVINVGVDLPDPTPPPVTQEFDCTDDGNGSRLVAQYRDSIRYCDAERAWYVWSGIRWERDETRRMLAVAKRVCRTIYIEAATASDDRREKVGKWAVASGMLPRLRAMIECASPAVAVTPEQLDARQNLWNCRNGTLDLDTMEFREARREDLLTKCCGVTYDPAAECPTWLEHLNLVFAGDGEYIRGFQELCGYALLQENPEQIMAILYGIGKNGKSVTIGALARVWEDYAVNIAAESLMVRRNEGPRSDLARLKGARMVTASEGESGAYLAEGVVKQLTGDDVVTVRRLYENEFEFKPGAKIFLATNHEPRIRGTDEGIWRRLWLLPFVVTIPEARRDPRILEHLEAEGAGILNWCLAGLRRYYENGRRLCPPTKVVAATQRFRSENDVIGRFLADEMVAEPIGTIERAVLYKIYTKWCEDESERPVSNRMLIKYLREKQFGERKMGGAWVWEGLRIKNTMEAGRDAAAGSAQGML
jgi:P4 family phage/plasmid primase-like protien